MRVIHPLLKSVWVYAVFLEAVSMVFFRSKALFSALLFAQTYRSLYEGVGLGGCSLQRVA